MVGSTQAERRACPKAMLQHLFSATSPRKNGQRPSVPMRQFPEIGDQGYGDHKWVTSGFRFLIWIDARYGKTVALNITQPSILNDSKPLPHLLTSSDPRPRPFLNLAETWQDKGKKCTKVSVCWTPDWHGFGPNPYGLCYTLSELVRKWWHTSNTLW